MIMPGADVDPVCIRTNRRAGRHAAIRRLNSPIAGDRRSHRDYANLKDRLRLTADSGRIARRRGPTRYRAGRNNARAYRVCLFRARAAATAARSETTEHPTQYDLYEVAHLAPSFQSCWQTQQKPVVLFDACKGSGSHLSVGLGFAPTHRSSILSELEQAVGTGHAPSTTPSSTTPPSTWQNVASSHPLSGAGALSQDSGDVGVPLPLLLHASKPLPARP
jgi:hypothetical protein